MKTLIYIILSVFCVSCNGQNIQNSEKNKSTRGAKLMDTLSILPLISKQYSNSDYKVLRLCNLDGEGYQIKSTERLEMTQQNKVVASISLPIPDEDIKNFSVSKIEETDGGFKIVTDWGGGNYFYGREFYFTFKNSQFYLDSLKVKSYTQEPEKETKTTKKISPQIPIDKFNILLYLENE